MYDLLTYVVIAGAAISILFIGATVRHLLVSDRMIGRRPVLVSMPLQCVWACIWSTNAALLACFLMAGHEIVGSTWSGATAVLFAVLSFLLWLISQRCVSYHTRNFTFVFLWESAGEVSLHVKVRGPVMLGHLLSRKRRHAWLVRLGLEEIRGALELSRQLPAQATVLTLASPWFGHGRHGTTLKRIGEILRDLFPCAAISPVSSTKTFVDGIVLLATSIGREWHRVARGRGIEVVGYKVTLRAVADAGSMYAITALAR